MHRWGLYEWLLSFAVVISYSSDFAEKSELKPLYSDYARNLDGLDLCGLGQKPHRIGSHRFHGFPTDFFDLCGLGMKGTQMAQMTQILTCPVWDFTDDSYSSDFAEESDEKICGNP